jgi:hypothetical protein
MNLDIELYDVVAVLLSDGWHTVADGSFTLGHYELIWMESDGTQVYCSSTAVQAVRTKASPVSGNGPRINAENSGRGEEA